MAIQQQTDTNQAYSAAANLQMMLITASLAIFLACIWVLLITKPAQ